ncbi:MAG: Gfo/Idh/MocA family oxidoreductase [Planctomycetota bacterium]|nr:MAG: Gfo/Idh/MocA family oxidoreductase [Planctomycetota bacterium]
MPPKIKRRHVLKNSALLGTGLWIVGGSGCAGPPKRPSIKRKSPSEKLNIAYIGCGGRGHANLRSTRGENIVALCDVDDERAAKVFENYPKLPKFKDFRVMLDKVKDIDAVVVSTADHTHAAASVMAMKMGKHVYCEKPLTPTIYEARIMAKVAEQTGVATQMGNQGHSHDGARRSVEMIRAGAIGPIREVHAWSDRPKGWWPQGVDRPKETPPVPDHLAWDLWLGPRPKRPYHSDYLPFKWRGWWEFGSGALGDMACHILDIFFWALEPGAPTSVQAEVSDRHIETAPVWEIIHWQFPARKNMPPVKLTWYDGGKQPPQELIHGQKMVGNGSLFIGDHGTLYVPDAYGGRSILLPKDKYVNYVAPMPTIPNSPGHHAEWIRACKTGNPTGSHFGYSGPMTETVLLGCIAARVKDGPIEWDPVSMRVTNVPAGNLFVRPPTYRKGWTL